MRKNAVKESVKSVDDWNTLRKWFLIFQVLPQWSEGLGAWARPPLPTCRFQPSWALQPRLCPAGHPTALPGPVWSAWLSTPRWAGCPCGRRAAGRSWPGRRRRPGTAACCSASPSGCCPGSSPRRTAPPGPGQEASRPLGIWFSSWQCSRLQTWGMHMAVWNRPVSSWISKEILKWGLDLLQILGIKGPYYRSQEEKETATHSSILAWKISWTEEPGGLHGVAKESDTT